MSKYDQLIILITRMVAFLVLLTALAAFKDDDDPLTIIATEMDEYSLFANCNHTQDDVL